MTPPDLDRLAEVRSELLAEPPEDSFRRRGWERGIWLLAQVDALLARVATLEGYAQHLFTCESWRHGMAEPIGRPDPAFCTCGFAALMEAAHG